MLRALNISIHTVRGKGMKGSILVKDLSSCQTRFSETGALKGHEKVHTGAKPFECKICGKIFVRNQHLKAHVVTQHAKDKEIPTLM